MCGQSLFPNTFEPEVVINVIDKREFMPITKYQ